MGYQLDSSPTLASFPLLTASTGKRHLDTDHLGSSHTRSFSFALDSDI